MVDIHLSLPDWTWDALSRLPTHFPTPEERMRVVVEFSRRNFEEQTGGPFAAGVFERDTGRLLVIGVNRVVPSGCSSAHAEIMALSIAQKMVGSFDLGGPGLPAHQIVVNWRPCAMCYGAVIWSGVRSLVIAGSGPELEAITGFDEGPLPADWLGELTRRGIEVIDGVGTAGALAAFRAFATSGQPVYNGRLGDAA